MTLVEYYRFAPKSKYVGVKNIDLDIGRYHINDITSVIIASLATLKYK